MKFVKLSLQSMPIADKIQFAQMVAQKLEFNVDVFPAPPFDVDTMADLIGALTSAYNSAQIARRDAQEKTTLQENAERAVDTMLSASGNYVQSVSAGDAAIIELAGMSVRDSGGRIGDLLPPEGVEIAPGEAEGQLSLRWNRVRGARCYLVDSSSGSVPDGWKRAAVSTKTRITLEGLTSGVRYWLRVAAIGAAGQGAWSDALARVAP